MRTSRPAWTVLLLALVAVICSGCWVERVPDSEREERTIVGIRRAVQTMLDSSAVAWNEGRLEGFMDDYVDSPSTTYLGASGLIEGWDGIYERYAPLFEPGAERGDLRFVDLKVRRLSATLALATARYILSDGEGRMTSSGHFTLVLRKVGRDWRIIHDHSSADPPPGSSADPPPGSSADPPPGES